MTDDRTMRLTELCFTTRGHAELVDVERDEVLWSSDDDDDFRDAHPDELLSVADALAVIEYLVENDIISPEEGEDLDVTEETDELEDDDEGDGVEDDAIEGEFEEQ